MDVLTRDVVALAKKYARELLPREAEMLALIEYAACVGAQLLAPAGKLDALPDIGHLYDEMLVVFLKHR